MIKFIIIRNILIRTILSFACLGIAFMGAITLTPALIFTEEGMTIYGEILNNFFKSNYIIISLIIILGVSTYFELRDTHKHTKTPGVEE
jgi:hypothetical protein